MTTAYDPTYHSRVRSRNLQKTGAVVSYLATVGKPVRTALDVGCNAGYMSMALLDAGFEWVDGLELSDGVIDDSLKSHPTFGLIIEDVSTWEPIGTWDVVLYCSVHHHIVQAYGIDVALQTFSKLVDACRHVLIFETGLMTEQGGHAWQKTLRSLYPSDQEHLDNLLAMAGDRLHDVRQITSLPIQGANRPIWAVTLCDGE